MEITAPLVSLEMSERVVIPCSMRDMIIFAALLEGLADAPTSRILLA